MKDYKNFEDSYKPKDKSKKNKEYVYSTKHIRIRAELLSKVVKTDK
jgi:hypothetical protein